MVDNKISIRSRFLKTIAAFSIALIVFATYIDRASRITVEESQLQNQQMQQVGVLVSDISNTLHLLGIAMYQATLFDKNDEPQIIQNQLETLSSQINRLISSPMVNANPEYYKPAMRLFDNLKALTIHAKKMLDINSDIQLKYPAMPIILEKLRPINLEMVGLIIGSIEEARNDQVGNPARERILTLLRDLRYVWSQLVGSVRVFVANRLGAFGPPENTMFVIQRDRQLYAEVISDLLSQLESYNKKELLGLIQQDSLATMKILHQQYQIHFEEAAGIYLSDIWRADKTLLRDELDPAMDVAWDQIYLILNRINAHTLISMTKFASTADKLSNYIWFGVVSTIILLLLGYLTFEHLIRRPIIDIALALEAEGKGESDIPQLKYEVKETNLLVNAFADMRNQVRSRQTRLQSILDNAGEGVLTITAAGIIETANKAACFLFGYEEKELVNHDFKKIVPAYDKVLKHQKINQHFSKRTDNTKLIPSEHEIVGRRKNGRKIPMSLRLGQTLIEGQVIFTALLSDISERKVMIDRLTQLAERDSLTGLYNRHFLMDELERIVDRSARGEKLHIALLYIDLDHFKYVNDTLGHLAGDKVLQDVTSIFEKRARGTDLVTRLGGDEFAILLYDVDELQAKATAAAYRKHLAEYVFHFEGKGVDVGCSIGVVLFNSTIKNKEELLSKADLACHLAKQAGRNRVHIYKSRDQHDINNMSTDMGWSRRIKLAIENDEFYQYSQPLIDIETGNIISHEVLLRLKDNQNNLIMPSGFLPAAERFGLSYELDKWVIKNSFRLLSEHQSREFEGYSINLSASTIDDEEALRFIEDELYRYNINPSQIIFEVTESNAISHLENAAQFLSELHKLGFKTALDDFGTGYSSFTYLKDLSVDFVKLDGSFIQNLPNDTVKIAIVKAMNEVAHALGKKTVAEFVEDEKTLDILREIGIDYCQGYFTGKPQPISNQSSNIHYIQN